MKTKTTNLPIPTPTLEKAWSLSTDPKHRERRISYMTPPKQKERKKWHRPEFEGYVKAGDARKALKTITGLNKEIGGRKNIDGWEFRVKVKIGFGDRKKSIWELIKSYFL